MGKSGTSGGEHEGAQPDRYRVEALAKGLSVLHAVATSRGAPRLGDLVRMTGLSSSSVFRLLRTLEAEGYVDAIRGGGYRPGPAVLTLGFGTLRALDFVEIAGPIVDRLAVQTGASVNLAVLVGSKAVYVYRIRDVRMPTANVQVGDAVPAACNSMGKALLARKTDDEVRELLLANGWPAELEVCNGPNAPKAIDDVLADLADARRVGYAIHDQEYTGGARSIAFCVDGPDGEAVCAMNIGALSSQYSVDELVERFSGPIQEAATEISRRLGMQEGLAPHATRVGKGGQHA